MAKAAKAPLLAQIPLDPRLAQLCDEGNLEKYDAELMSTLANALTQAVTAKAK